MLNIIVVLALIVFAIRSGRDFWTCTTIIVILTSMIWVALWMAGYFR